MHPAVKKLKIEKADRYIKNAEWAEAQAKEYRKQAAALRREVRESAVDDFACDVTYTAIAPAQADQWEASCPCGFFTKGTKEQCRQRANGHPPRRM